MKTQKLVFDYSHIYDEVMCNLMHEKYDYTKFSTRAEAYIKKLRKAWLPSEKEIFRELSKITGVTLNQDIICYVNTYGPFSFSSPLTLNIMSSFKPKKEKPVLFNIDLLIHECVHNYTWRCKFSKKIDKYKNETQCTKIHIIVHAIIAHLMLNVFSKKRLDNIKRFNRTLEYKRAWEIVEKEGYKNILSWIKK